MATLGDLGKAIDELDELAKDLRAGIAKPETDLGDLVIVSERVEARAGELAETFKALGEIVDGAISKGAQKDEPKPKG